MKKLLTCGLTVLVFAMSAKANIRVTPSGAEYYGAGASVSNLFVRGEQIIVTNGTLAVQDGTNAPITYVDEGTLATNLLGYVSTNDFASLSSNVASSNLVFQGHYNLLSTQKLDVAVAATQVWSVSQYPLAVTGTPWSASVSSNYDAIAVLATGKVDVITWSSSNQVYQGHYDLLSTQKLDVVVAATQVWSAAQYPLALTNAAAFATAAQGTKADNAAVASVVATQVWSAAQYPLALTNAAAFAASGSVLTATQVTNVALAVSQDPYQPWVTVTLTNNLATITRGLGNVVYVQSANSATRTNTFTLATYPDVGASYVTVILAGTTTGTSWKADFTTIDSNSWVTAAAKFTTGISTNSVIFERVGNGKFKPVYSGGL